MSDTIIVAIITGVFAFSGMLISGFVTLRTNAKTLKANHDATITEIQTTNTLINARLDVMQNNIDDLTEKVKIHNNYDRRLIAMETELRFVKEMTRDDGK